MRRKGEGHGGVCLLKVSHIYGDQDNLQELVLSFHQACSGDETQVISLAEASIYPSRHAQAL